MDNGVDRLDKIAEEGLIASLIPTSTERQHHITLDIAPAAIFKVLATLAAVWFVVHIYPVIVLVALSLMLVATFNPLVRKMQARMRRSWAIIGLVTGVVVVFLGMFALLIPPLISQGINLVQNAPRYTRDVQAVLAQRHIHVNVQQKVDRMVGEAGDEMPQMVSLLSSAVNILTAFATVAILTIYLLIEGPEVGKAFMRLLPRKDRLGVRRLVGQIGEEVGGYMRGQIITSALAGGFSFITLWLLGVPEALALSALAAIADVIPIIGLLIAVVPAALVALTLAPGKATIVIVVYLVYHQLESHLIGPKIYGSTLGLSLTVIVISMLIGVELMGILGAVLALPVAAAIPTIVSYIQDWQESHGAVEHEGSLP